MSIKRKITSDDVPNRLNLNKSEFVENKYAYYQWLREEAPIYKGKILFFDLYLISRYEDCYNILKDHRFVRNMSTVTGGTPNWLSSLIPRNIKIVTQTMMTQDGEEHRRLRTLVHKAFTPSTLRKIENRIEHLTHELLNKVENQKRIDLIQAYSLPIPATVISEMVGVQDEDMSTFQQEVSAYMSRGNSLTTIKSFLWHFPRIVSQILKLISHKRLEPSDDILSNLIHADEAGDKLSEDELVAMIILLISAGYETTTHLITNAVLTLLQHPDQLEKLLAEPSIMPSAVEEILRFNSPAHGTGMSYATEEITLHDVTIKQGEIVLPLVASANRDPSIFDNPDKFDITRSPNKHLGFGHGIHYCLGAPLARIETQIALNTLFEHYPNLRLAIPVEELVYSRKPGFHTYESLPVILNS